MTFSNETETVEHVLVFEASPNMGRFYPDTEYKLLYYEDMGPDLDNPVIRVPVGSYMDRTSYTSHRISDDDPKYVIYEKTTFVETTETYRKVGGKTRL